MSITPELYEFIVKVIEDRVKEIKVTREEYDKLEKAVRELAEKVKELAEAQKRTEERLGELVEAQRRTEERLDQLALRVDQLAEAQKRTEERLKRLAEAQQRTEMAVQRLSEAVSELSRQVGRLSDVVGFGLEDIARVMAPGWFERHMGIYVEDLSPRFVTVDGTEIQINLFGIGKKNAREIVIVGECKSRIYAREVKKFAETLEKIRKAFQGREVLGFLFGYLVHPSAQEEAKKYNIVVLATYMR
mgnify:CR=1 FL=1